MSVEQASTFQDQHADLVPCQVILLVMCCQPILRTREITVSSYVQHHMCITDTYALQM
jgi:hypothetical protein